MLLLNSNLSRDTNTFSRSVAAVVAAVVVAVDAVAVAVVVSMIDSKTIFDAKCLEKTMRKFTSENL